MIDFENVNCALCGSDDQQKLFSKHHIEKFTIVKCNKCGFIFMNPMITESGLKKIYTKDYYKTYNINSYDESQKKLLDAYDVSLFRKMLKISGKETGKLLDIGCAMGFFLNSVKKSHRGWKVFGCDVSKESTRYGKTNLGLDLRTGTVEQCKYPDNFFDMVVMREVIEHIKDPMSTLQEIKRIMKDDGCVVIQTGNLESMSSKFRGKDHFYYQIHHVSYFSLKTIQKILENAGFHVTRITDIHYIEKDKLDLNGFNIKTWANLMALSALGKARVGNFSVMGGMIVFAEKA